MKSVLVLVACFVCLSVTVPTAEAQRGGRRGFGPSPEERLESVAEMRRVLGDLEANYEQLAEVLPSLRNWRDLPDDERDAMRRVFRESRETELGAIGTLETELAKLSGTRQLRSEHAEAMRRLRAIRDLAAEGEETTVTECLDALISQREDAFRERLATLGLRSDESRDEGPEPPTDGIASGKLWPDDKGVHINAHGGGVLYHDGHYYWFGEHKTAGPGGNQANVGVHCYRSNDLQNWADAGVALAVSEDPKSDIVSGCVLERPKVIYNESTGKFVMWFHLELKGQGYAAARTGVAVADEPAGPYRFIRSLRPNAGVWPENFPDELRTEASARSDGHGAIVDGVYVRRDYQGGQMARDMTLFVDDDGKAYHVHSAEENYTLHLSELSDDYLSFTGRYIRIFPGGHNEAPALFKRGGKYYLLTSGCTGWDPNAARSAVADSIWGPWESLGNPCVGVNPSLVLGPEKTFGGQSTYVLPVAGKEDAFIAMFDEWRPQNAIDGRYYWLPVEFTDDGAFAVRWKTQWDVSALDEGGDEGG